MFGYVIANNDKLTPQEQARYKACYCGLCHELGQRYGKLSRMILSYDLVFLILVRSAYHFSAKSGANMTEVMQQERCIAHPHKPHYFWCNSETAYAADMSILLSYYQVEDDWKDDKKIISLGERQLLKKAFQKVEGVYPEIGAEIQAGLEELSKIEISGRLEPDAAAAAFGRVMAAVFAGPEKNGALAKLGFALGKWIYIMDACLDRKEDLKKMRYNPIPALPEESFEMILNCLMADCVDAYQTLNLKQDKGIVENILFSGVWTRFEVWKKKKEKKNEGSV